MNSETPTQDTIDAANATFWNELCGSHAARVIGVTGNDAASLKKYDDWFFSYYSYLYEIIPFDLLSDKDVLEVGLGYGSVAQRLAQSAASFTGLDIAAGPVAALRHRLKQAGLRGRAIH
jgi:2-polyprenyl-3-methyl-5-hydroxy-6-metoxy-1,4-benzoquinol methylase